TKTPLALALRGRFLAGSRPVGGDFARRFVASAAENGIDVFRLHDPLNDVSNLTEAAEAITGADREFDAGIVYSPGRTGETDAGALAGLGSDTGVDVDTLWRASDLVDEHIGDEPVAPLAPRIATLAAQHSLPAGLVAALDVHLRAHAAGDRLVEVLEELSV